MSRALAVRLANQPYLLLTFTALFWAGNAIAGKLAAGVVPPLTFTFLRWSLTTLVLFIIARPYIAADAENIRRHRPFLYMLGAFGFAGFNFALYTALNYTTAINVTIEQSAMPMVIMVFGFLIFRERFLAAQAVGAILSVVGVAMTVTHGDLTALLRLDLNIGDAIMVIGVLLYSGYSVALRRKPAMDWRVFMFALATGAMLFSAPFAAYEVLTGHYPQMSWKTPALVFYITVFPSLMAQIFFIRGVELIGANRSGIFVNLVPLFGALLAILLLGETFELYHAIGLGLVLTGIALAETASRRRSAA